MDFYTISRDANNSRNFRNKPEIQERVDYNFELFYRY